MNTNWSDFGTYPYCARCDNKINIDSIEFITQNDLRHSKHVNKNSGEQEIIITCYCECYKKEGEPVLFNWQITESKYNSLEHGVIKQYKKSVGISANEYQQLCLKTAIYDKNLKFYPVLGLSGESAEVTEKLLEMLYKSMLMMEINSRTGKISEKVKKIYRDKNGLFSEEDRLTIAKELGDLNWYSAVLAHEMGYTLEEIMQMNLDKLKSRQERNVISGSGDDR